VAGKISNNKTNIVMKNLGDLIYYANEIWKMGHAPYCPAMNSLLGMLSGELKSYDDYMKIGLEYLVVCDAIFMASMSPGAKEERTIAINHDLLIFDTLGALRSYSGIRFERC
jgi:hypothetical protein